MPDTDGDYPWSGGDDLFSWLWLGTLLLTLIASIATTTYLVVSGRITVDLALTGQVDIGTLIMDTLRPIILALTGLAILEIYGAKRIRSLLDNWGGR